MWVGAGTMVAADPPGERARIGRIEPQSARAIVESPWSIGGETLDRDFAVYENCRDHVGELGATRIRLQAGWQKRERERGRIDLGWMDAIVDDALARGVRPWLELSELRATATPTTTRVAVARAWAGAFRRLMRRLQPETAGSRPRFVIFGTGNRLREWEVWNEPDLQRGSIEPEVFAEFHARTAAIIRREHPQARIWALALAGDLGFAERFLRRLAETGRTNLLDAITVHGYLANPDDLGLVRGARELARRWAPHAVVLQGELARPPPATRSAR